LGIHKPAPEQNLHWQCFGAELAEKTPALKLPTVTRSLKKNHPIFENVSKTVAKLLKALIEGQK
jgi:hypothetical protein